MAPKQRLHVLSLPHTATRWEFSWCAYTMKALKFARMMEAAGYEVFLYAAEGPSDFHQTIGCVADPGTAKVTEPQWSQDYFAPMNDRIVEGIDANYKDKTDLICCITGTPQKPVADAFPDNMAVEYGVGYSGVFAAYRVWESYGWMHSVYGFQCGVMKQEVMARLGIFYDAVIPNYYEMDQFPAGYGLGDSKGEYLLFIGRLIEAKGYRIALETAQRAGMRLKLAGSKYPDTAPLDGAEYVGVVGPEERAELMGNALAVMVPSLYTEPFGGVCAEAQLCGTPVITTDWGAFPELVVPDVTGFRCRNQKEFDKAARAVRLLPRGPIRKRAISLWSADQVGKQYDAYFQRLSDIWGEGFFAS